MDALSPSPYPEEKKAKVIILAGFLGAGKTTLLKRILNWEGDMSGTVIIVNEFGEVGIDGSLLKDAGSDVIELTSGCICCTLQADLHRVLQRVWEQFKPDRIFIEATGLADPKAIAKTLEDPGLIDCMEVYKVFTVLDVDYWEARKVFGPFFLNQLRDADLILLNKIDTVDQRSIPQFLAEIHETLPRSRVIPTVHCAVDPEALWAEDSQTVAGESPDRFYSASCVSSDEKGLPHHHGSHQQCLEGPSSGIENYVSFFFESSDPLEEKRFDLFVENLPWEVFRMKGVVRFENQTLMVNYAGGRGRREEWAESDKTVLTFIGLNINPEDIIQGLHNCTISS